ncbi:MAG: hypothetical protein B6241_02625 [Spirochaetaceae bacterium 4572_59]|nr:MAG: hypothetical protein B6241_02625 [Spirochaetaceae bacterium 4572_59]
MINQKAYAINDNMNSIILAGALVWDRILGEPSVKIHPTVWMGNYIRFIWEKKKRRSPLTDFIWGAFLLLSGVILFSIPVFFLFQFVGSSQPVLKVLLGIPFLKVSFSIRYLLQAAGEIRDELLLENLAEARRLTAYHLVSRDTSTLSQEEIVSAVIESVAENITDSFISPLFYFFLCGIPGAWAFRFINTGDAMIAYRNKEYEWGGKTTAWADSFLNWIPARLTGIGIVLATLLIPGISGKNSWKSMIKNHSRTASPNAGWTMGAMAGSLNIRLEKKGEYLLDGGSDTLTASKIDNCLKITLLSLIMTMFFLILLVQGGVWALNMAV